MCYCHRGIRQGPTWDSLASAQQLDFPSALFTLHPGWGVLNMQRAALRRRKNGVNWTDCDLAKRCNALEHLGASVWHQIGSCASRGTERRGAVPLGPALPARALACFPESGSGSVGPGAAMACTGIGVSKSAFAQAPWRQPSPNQRGQRGPESRQVWLLARVALQVRRGPAGRGALSAPAS